MLFRSAAAAYKSAVGSGTAGGIPSAGTGSTVQIDTTHLDVSRRFAVCYSEGAGTLGTGFIDSGIRITLPQVYNIQANSGYSDVFTHGGSALDGIPVRNMKSLDQTTGLRSGMIDRPTNRHPLVAGVKVNYVAHSTNGAGSNTYRPDNTNDGIRLSLVDDTLNSNDPCTDGQYPTANGGAASSRVMSIMRS